ncbi:hypothetical protein EDC39_103201 [Geothermobacter ehrlichii]|uniref:Uncharacterized protein n=1 Tax=Geothermobacter ehrlichii TaxID=213224 RepID=A0A5D3WK58_9BACT|nr:hypothetical protein [Geothermobacter ehrlichii]TYO99355.1 hypothetical protein EDC39_103201 [Geothermobacter ehrlichii]
MPLKTKKIVRLGWVLVMLVCAFLLGRYLQPKPAAMTRVLRQASPLDFSRVRLPGGRMPTRVPYPHRTRPHQN